MTRGQEQFDFDEPAKRYAQRNHPETTRKAARSVDAETARRIVYGFIVKRGDLGATDHEITTRTGIPPNTARPRRVELKELGRIRDSGRRRETSTGSKAIVWVAEDEREAARRPDEFEAPDAEASRTPAWDHSRI